MEDLGRPGAGRPNTVSGATQLLGLIMGLCAVLAGIAALSDWRDETAQASWPSVSAVIDHGGTTFSPPAKSDGGALVWKLDYRVRFTVNGTEQLATLRSRGAASNTTTAGVRAWAARHRRGSTIYVRYDPLNPSRVVLSVSDVPSTDPRTHTDLVLIVLFCMASAGLIVLAKHLRREESRELPETDPDTPTLGGRVAPAFVSGAVGFVIIGTAASAAIHAPGPVTSNGLIAIPAGLIFVLGGALVALPPGGARWRGVFSALLITCFALTFDWVAFGPGERRFGGGASFGLPIGIGFAAGEAFGRAAFGIAAIVLDVFALILWMRLRTASKL